MKNKVNMLNIFEHHFYRRSLTVTKNMSCNNSIADTASERNIHPPAPPLCKGWNVDDFPLSKRFPPNVRDFYCVLNRVIRDIPRFVFLYLCAESNITSLTQDEEFNYESKSAEPITSQQACYLRLY